MSKRLSDDEFRSLFYAYKQGDRQALDKLVDTSQGLVAYVADRSVAKAEALHSAGAIQSKVQWDELMQAGNYGLITALERFKPELNFQFNTFAFDWIKKEINLFLRSSMLIGTSRFDFRRAVSINDGRRDQAQRGIKDKEQRAEAAVLVRKMLELFPKRKREVLILRFGLESGEEMSCQEVGERLGMKRSAVSTIVHRCLARLKVVHDHFQKTGKIMRQLPRESPSK